MTEFLASRKWGWLVHILVAVGFNAALLLVDQLAKALTGGGAGVSLDATSATVVNVLAQAVTSWLRATAADNAITA